MYSIGDELKHRLGSKISVVIDPELWSGRGRLGEVTIIEYLRYMEGEKHPLFFTGNGMLFPKGDSDVDKGIAGVANDTRVAIDTFQFRGQAP
jgi:hypothetical protein